jgi:hypothetical protein
LNILNLPDTVCISRLPERHSGCPRGPSPVDEPISGGLSRQLADPILRRVPSGPQCFMTGTAMAGGK